MCEGLKLGKALSGACVQARGNCPVLQDCTSGRTAEAPYRPNEGEETQALKLFSGESRRHTALPVGRELVCLSPPEPSRTMDTI